MLAGNGQRHRGRNGQMGGIPEQWCKKRWPTCKANGRNEPLAGSLLGVNNESWGCGGEMTPEFYADQYRGVMRCTAVIGSNAKLLKIARRCQQQDYNWTETLMKMWVLTNGDLPCITILCPPVHGVKRFGHGFDEKEYFNTMSELFKMEELVTRQPSWTNANMIRRKDQLVVDEWGIWTDVEPGTNPGFLWPAKQFCVMRSLPAPRWMPVKQPQRVAYGQPKPSMCCGRWSLQRQLLRRPPIMYLRPVLQSAYGCQKLNIGLRTRLPGKW